MLSDLFPKKTPKKLVNYIERSPTTWRKTRQGLGESVIDSQIDWSDMRFVLLDQMHRGTEVSKALTILD